MDILIPGTPVKQKQVPESYPSPRDIMEKSILDVQDTPKTNSPENEIDGVQEFFNVTGSIISSPFVAVARQLDGTAEREREAAQRAEQESLAAASLQAIARGRKSRTSLAAASQAEVEAAKLAALQRNLMAISLLVLLVALLFYALTAASEPEPEPELVKPNWLKIFGKK